MYQHKMDEAHGLLATTRYPPRLRLEPQRSAGPAPLDGARLRGLAQGRRAMASWDEDPVTMAVGKPSHAAVLARRNGAGAEPGLHPPALRRTPERRYRLAARWTWPTTPPCKGHQRQQPMPRWPNLAAALKRGDAAHAVLAADHARPASAGDDLRRRPPSAPSSAGAPVAQFVAHAGRHADLVDHTSAAGCRARLRLKSAGCATRATSKLAAATIRHCLESAG